MTCLSIKESGEWKETLDRTFQHDWYHLSDAHALAERNGEGTAYLFVHREDSYVIAIPLLLRPLEAVPGLGSVGSGWYDATSVYGYAGPVASDEVVPSPVIEHFQAGLKEMLWQMRVVSVFSRLHPLIRQRDLLRGLGEVISIGQTVSIDLTLHPDAQYRQFYKGHREDIRKAKRLGLVCVEDKEHVYWDDLIGLYGDNMRRVNASRYYYFDQGYFERLFNISGCEARLFVVLQESGLVLSAHVLLVCKGIVQDHLGGARGDAIDLAPKKLYIDTIRHWAASKGCRVFHLGGGRGGRPDSLFHFKAGFSSCRNDFFTWRWVVYGELYEALNRQRARHAGKSESALTGDGFFPAYRAPETAEWKTTGQKENAG